MTTISDARPRLTVGEVMVSVHPSMLSVLLMAPWPDAMRGICLSDRASTGEAARLMLRTGSSLVLAVDDDGHPVGMVLRNQISSDRPRRPRARARPDHVPLGRPSRQPSCSAPPGR